MYKKYLITGATGFLGRNVIDRLVPTDAQIFALCMPSDPFVEKLPPEVVPVCGDVRDETSLAGFFDNADESSCVIHCAGIVSVASRPGRGIYDVNVGGTRNVLSFCLDRGVAKCVYVSSVHAIPEKPSGTLIDENAEFSPELVYGDYSKSKAEATRLVFDAAKRGLDASVVFPSGIIGPGDEARGSITSMLSSYLAGKLPYAVKGGYDFVDVRDVADGIVSCAVNGKRGEGYILSGHYVTIKEIVDVVKEITGMKKKVVYFPMCVAKAVAPTYERIAVRKKQKLFFTPYAVKVLSSNGRFSNEKARELLGYNPRPVSETLKDAVAWIGHESSACAESAAFRPHEKAHGK